jgi:undecaprenyl diphosphate synthase
MTNSTATAAVPQHIGIIMDGNRRWAREHGLTTAQGHKQGYLTLKVIAKAGLRRGIKYLTAYAFSSENWQRDKAEVEDILRLLIWALKHEVQELHKDGIRLRFIGSKVKFGAATVRAILRAEELTKDNTRATLLLCLDYGGQQEIVAAVKRIAEAGIAPEDITPELITGYLYAPDVPPLDLVVRTSGEQRLSNFMLWEAAYSELAFTKTAWPDFSEADLDAVLADYAQRHRRFGAS